MTTASEFEQQASAWLVRRDRGALPAEQEAAFHAWMGADPRNRAAYLRLESAWKRTDNLRRLRPLDGPVNEDLLERSPFVRVDEYTASDETKRSAEQDELEEEEREEARQRAKPASTRRRWWRFPFVPAVAVVLVMVAAGAWYAYERTAWHEYATDFGGFERIVLDDGSVVQLNTNSVLRVQLTEELRQIELERGEALFKVVHDANRPFDVRAGSTIVRAVGTEFSVRVREPSEAKSGQKNVEVLVREGRVAIDPPKKPLERTAALPASVSTLSAGESVTITANRFRVAKVAVEEVSRKLSWTEGRLWFEGASLKDVVAEFNRYNRRQMVIADPTIEDMKIGGGFEATDPESFVAALESALGVRAFPSGASGEQEVLRLVGTEER